jgi:hypothetical protein
LLEVVLVELQALHLQRVAVLPAVALEGTGLRQELPEAEQVPKAR